DAPLDRDESGGRSHLDLLESGGERPDVAAEGDEFRKLLREKFAAFDQTLHGREQTLFQERLMSDTPATLQEIGEKYGISRERGESVALISEAGMPAISDPGQRLVARAAAAGVRVEVLPGASAALCALVGSGLSTDRFHFVGFPPRERGPRQELLGGLRTLVA